MGKHICKKCDEREQQVECNLCKLWMCWKCADVKTKNKSFVSKEDVPGLYWLCNYGCNDNLKEIVKDVEKMRERMDNELEERNKGLCEEYEEDAKRKKKELDELEERNKRQCEEYEEEVERKNKELDDLRAKLEESNKDLQEMNDKFTLASVMEEGLKEENEDLKIELSNAEVVLKDIKGKHKTVETAAKRKDKEIEQLKEEVAQYSGKIRAMSEEEDHQKKMNKILVKQINDLEKINERLELGAGAGRPQGLEDHNQDHQSHARMGKPQNNERDHGRRGEHGESSHEERKQKLCTKFAYGNTCRFGAKCRFVHQKICKNYAAEGRCRHGNKCHFSHDVSGRCKREEESGECHYGDQCWYGHIWGTHVNSDTNQYRRLTNSRGHIDANSYGQRNDNHRTREDGNYKYREPTWNSYSTRGQQHNFINNPRENNYSGVNEETMAEFGKHLHFLVQQMSGWSHNNTTQSQVPQGTRPQYQQPQQHNIQASQQPPTMMHQSQPLQTATTTTQ